MKIRQMGKLTELVSKWCAQHVPILCCSFICCFALRFVSSWCFQPCTLSEYRHGFISDHWARCEQLRSKMKVLRVVSIELDSNKHVTIRHVLYKFWQLLYKSGLGLRVYRIMGNHYIYESKFALDFERNYLTNR